MTHRERIIAALKHEQPDRVPMDLGSTMATTLTVAAHERLQSYLGLPAGEPPVTFARKASTVVPDERILESFDVDARPLLLGVPDGRPDRQLPDGGYLDEWGVMWTKPKNGHYINTKGPFGCLQEPAVQDLDRVEWPEAEDPGRYCGLGERARALHGDTDYAVVLNLGVGPVHLSQFMRGYAEWLMDLLAAPAFAEALLTRTADWCTEVAIRALREAGENVDLVVFGDDLGTQNQALVRPELYRRLIKPQHRRIIDAVKRFGKPILLHSCGSVIALIPDLIEAGVDALNPIQVTAANMDTKRLKREFGKDLTFWGAVDNQGVLPRGTVREVREEVRRRIEDLASGGGYVLCATQDIQADVPPENVVAMYEAAQAYGRCQ